jgi:acetyltransferase-like isoleucine patch superfamily enzyme
MMRKIFVYQYKTTIFVWKKTRCILDYIVTYYIFYVNNVKFKSYRAFGIPHVDISLKGKCEIDSNLTINNRMSNNPVGRGQGKCYITVRKNACLKIGKNVGISSSTIYCQKHVKIGDDVKIGSDVVIYDTDFHSLNPLYRKKCDTDMTYTKTAAVEIEDNVFIGARSTILKGIVIGKNSIIGAGSVVGKNIPANEIWAGNPIKQLGKIIIKDEKIHDNG